MSQIGILTFQTWSLAADSLSAGLVVSPLLGWRERIRLALLFGLCDGVASWIGSGLPHDLPAPAAFWLYSCCVLLLALAARRSGKWLMAMPFVLAIDNLAAASPASLAPGSAVAGTIMALTGMALAAAADAGVRRGLRLIPAGSLA